MSRHKAACRQTSERVVSDSLSSATKVVIMYQTDPPRSPQETMPTMYDLPSELVGESGLPDEFHRLQADLLSETCQPLAYPSEEILLASDLNLYYDPRHPLCYKRPD